MARNAALLPLRSLIDGGMAREAIETHLSHFECSRDDDVVFFLKNYAIDNEILGESRTYFAVDADEYEQGRLEILAFFTLAISTTDCSSMSNRAKRRSFGEMPGIARNDHFAGFLLAQIARCDTYTFDDLDCSELIVEAEEIMGASAERTGGHIIYLDCKAALQHYYERQGYAALYFDEEKGLFKMFKCIEPLAFASVER